MKPRTASLAVLTGCVGFCALVPPPQAARRSTDPSHRCVVTSLSLR
jgi:hypothetical protein